MWQNTEAATEMNTPEIPYLHSGLENARLKPSRLDAFDVMGTHQKELWTGCAVASLVNTSAHIDMACVLHSL